MSRSELWSAEASDERSHFYPVAKRNGWFGGGATEGAYQATHGTGFNRIARTYRRRLLRREHALESISYFERAGTTASRHSTFRSRSEERRVGKECRCGGSREQ